MNNPNIVVEIAMSRAKEGVDEAEIWAAATAAQADMDSLPGIIRRETLKDENGLWVDIVYWESMEAAQNALPLAHEKPQLARLFSLLDLETSQMYHLHPVLFPQQA